MTVVERARRYLATMPRAISGSRGHDATFSAAVALVKGFSLADHIALAELRTWNQTHCDPPWSDADLRHKIRSSVQSDKPSGYLLGDGENGGAVCSTSLSDEEARRKAEARKDWPAFRSLSATTLAEIATLRRLPLEAVHIVHNAGLLSGAMIDGHRCFLLHEGNFAQARRLNGGMLPVPSGEAKSKNLRGSQGGFIGKALLGRPGSTGPAGPVLLVEGCIGLLEAIAAAVTVNADTAGWSVIAAVSASARFDSTWLERLRRRRIRIVPDRDMAGVRACGIWTAALDTVGCKVDAIPMPPEHKDLGELLADPSTFRETLESIFRL